MFKVKEHGDYLILTPNWNSNEESIIVFERVKIVEDDNYCYVVLGNAFSSNCGQWDKDEKKFKDVEVKGKVVALRLLKKDIELYDKKFSPTTWDKILMTEFKKSLEVNPEGNIFGTINCSSKNEQLITEYFMAVDAEKKERVKREFFDVQAKELEPNKELEDFKIPEQSTGKGYAKKETTPEVLNAKVEWFSQFLGKALLNDESSSISQIFQYQYKTSTATDVEKIFIVEQMIEFAKGVING